MTDKTFMETLAGALLMEGRITPNTARMLLGQIPADESAMKLHPHPTPEFKFGDAVTIDGGAVVGRVIGFAFYPHGHQVQVSWWNSGALVEQWIGEYRLSVAEEVRR